MRAQEVIENLKYVRRAIDDCPLAWTDAVETAMQVVNMQIPEKPVYESIEEDGIESWTAYCPECGEFLNSETICPKCGQWIDWKAGDEE